MINKLTGMTVSEESQKVLAKLSEGHSVLWDEIRALPEMQEAYSCINNSIETIALQHRTNLQIGITEKLLTYGSAVIDSNGKTAYTGVVGQDYRVDIVIGLPASGKSSALVDPLSQEFKSRVIDSDMAKELIPEFNGGWGAGVVHEESKAIVTAMRTKASYAGDNIVYPIVGSTLNKVVDVILDFKNAGYDVYLHYCELSPEKALGRMMNRFFETGRFLVPKLIAEYGNRPKETFEQLKGAYDYEHSKQQSTSIFPNHLRDGDEVRRNGFIPTEMVQRTSRRIDSSFRLRDLPAAKTSSDRSRTDYHSGITAPESIYKKGAYDYEHSKQQSTSTVHDHLRDRDEVRGNGSISAEMVQQSSRGFENENLSRAVAHGRPSPSGSGLSSDTRIENPETVPSKSIGTLISGYSYWSNDVPRGHFPIMLESTCHGQVFDIGAQNHYRRELQKNGFIPSESLLNSCVQLYRQTGKLSSLKDICTQYKNQDSIHSLEERETIKHIGDSCRAQEAQRCPSFSCSQDHCPEM